MMDSKNNGQVWLSPRFIAMLRQYHDGMQTRVQNDGEFSEPFEVTNRVKQDCTMVPTLFSMLFSAMLMLFRTVNKNKTEIL